MKHSLKIEYPLLTLSLQSIQQFKVHVSTVVPLAALGEYTITLVGFEKYHFCVFCKLRSLYL